jgi:3-phenylpropionate/trans-cinnamate dioxygenase ferredoxin reductase subunit
MEKSNEENVSKINEIQADLIILGLGVKPKIEYLFNSITTSENYIKCDAYGNTSDSNIFAAGDICSYPNIYTGERV